MAKFFRNSTIVVLTYHEDGSPVSGPADEEFRVRSLGRGRWFVECEDGWHAVLRTAELQRYFKASDWVEEYDFDGEPVYAHQSVRVERDPWWRW